MPATLLSALHSLFAGDQYLLQDGLKAASFEKNLKFKPPAGVKQGCPLSPLLFPLYINDIGMVAEGVQGAVTKSEDVWVTHMLYADSLTQLANAPDAMQTMLNRLVVYARSKHLTINTAKSEAVCFNLKSVAQVPTFMLAGTALKCSDSFRCLGMTFHHTLKMTASSEHAAILILAAAHPIRGFVRDTVLCDRPQAVASLWLANTYTKAFLQGHPINYSGFTADLRFRMRKVWRGIADMDLLESDNKLVTYHSWFACPLLGI